MDFASREGYVLFTRDSDFVDLHSLRVVLTQALSISLSSEGAGLGANWDLVAGALIAAEAGAVVRWPGDDGLTVAVAPGIADELISLLESVAIV